jgi:hypothetical protein
VYIPLDKRAESLLMRYPSLHCGDPDVETMPCALNKRCGEIMEGEPWWNSGGTKAALLQQMQQKSDFIDCFGPKVL